MGHGHKIHIEQEQFQFPKKTKTLCLALIIIGLLLTIVGIVTIPKHDAHADAKNHHTEAAVAETHEPEKTVVALTTDSIHSDSVHTMAAVETHANHTENEHQAHASTGSVSITGIDTLHNNEVKHPIAQEHAKPWYTRVYVNLLLNGYFILLISVCGLFFFALQYIANAGWAIAFIRVPQAMSTFIPVGAVLLLLVFFLDGGNIYHWVHYEHLHLTRDDVGFDKILDNKKWFLNTKMVVSFLVTIPLVWFLFGKKLRGLSATEDKEGGLVFFKKGITYSAAFTVIFGFTLSILSWIVAMAVDAHWYSTMFSLYNFATGWVSCLSIIALFVLYLRRNGYLKLITDEHIHDLGKFMFAFSIFWTYLWLSQFLLIWYANIPEESVYFYKRWEMPFKISFFVNLILNFLIPFLVLMTRNNKRNPKILTFVAICILAGHWNDLWLMLMPGTIDKQAQVGFLEVGMTLFFAGVFIYWVLTALSKKGLVAINHPYIEESAHHDVGV